MTIQQAVNTIKNAHNGENVTVVIVDSNGQEWSRFQVDEKGQSK